MKFTFNSWPSSAVPVAGRPGRPSQARHRPSAGGADRRSGILIRIKYVASECVYFASLTRRTSCLPFCSNALPPATACRRTRRTKPTTRNDPFSCLARSAPGSTMSFRKETGRIPMVRSKWTAWSFGALEFGGQHIFRKIDDCGRQLEPGSEDPANRVKTIRVLRRGASAPPRTSLGGDG
jgi:hypothetical protein